LSGRHRGVTGGVGEGQREPKIKPCARRRGKRFLD